LPEIVKKTPSKLFEFEQCFFHVKFDVEKPLDGGGDNEDDDDARDEAVVVDDDEELEDDFQEKVDKISNTEATSMDIAAGATAPTPGAGKSAHNAMILCSSALKRV
jgi:hypothetical protein